MSAGSTILAGRAFNESLMTSACIIGDEVQGTVLDEATGTYPTEIVNPSYEGPCKIRFISSVTSQVDAQAQLLVEQDAVLSLPVETSGEVSVRQMCRITENDLDPAMVGKQFRITGDHTQTAATARRFPVELIS